VIEPVEAMGGEDPPSESIDVAAPDADATKTAVAEPSPATAPASAAPDTAEEPQFIEIWRPTRYDERRGPKRHQRAGRRPSPQAPAQAEPAEAKPGSPARAATDAKGDRPQHHHRHRRGEDQSAHTGRANESKPEPSKRSDQPRQRFREQRRDWQDKAPDPNSPFAKLAALKAQLEANAKERR
jgi:ATP-dependent RNA helicase SUPV3L1/SUV3